MSANPTQTIRLQQRTNCLGVFDNFVGLAVKGLTTNFNNYHVENDNYHIEVSSLSQSAKQLKCLSIIEALIEWK